MYDIFLERRKRIEKIIDQNLRWLYGEYPIFWSSTNELVEIDKDLKYILNRAEAFIKEKKFFLKRNDEKKVWTLLNQIEQATDRLKDIKTQTQFDLTDPNQAIIININKAISRFSNLLDSLDSIYINDDTVISFWNIIFHENTYIQIWKYTIKNKADLENIPTGIDTKDTVYWLTFIFLLR